LSTLRKIIKLVPTSLRKQVLEMIKREYRLGWPDVLITNEDSELDLLDIVLAHYARRNSHIRFVQVGACDGVMGDSLFPLIERYDMRGMLIEPRPDMFELLRRNYAARYGLEGFTFVNVAIARSEGMLNMYSIKPGVPGPDWLTGTASLDKNVLLHGLSGVADPDALIRVEQVKAVTFETLFESYPVGAVDLLQIDAEGYDAEILRMFDLGRWRPAIVRFEHLHLSPPDYEDALKLLVDHQYKIGLSANDTIAYRAVN